jgi:hypothetical protein
VREEGLLCSPLFLDWCLLCAKCVFPQVPSLSPFPKSQSRDISQTYLMSQVSVCVSWRHTLHTHTHTHTHLGQYLGHEIHTAHTHTNTHTHSHLGHEIRQLCLQS